MRKNVIKILIVLVGIGLILLLVEIFAEIRFAESDKVDDVALLESLSENPQNELIDQNLENSDQVVSDSQNTEEVDEQTNTEVTAPDNSEQSNTELEPEISDSTDAESATQPETSLSQSLNLETMIVAGGCFWCVEADMEKAPGVLGVVSGYSGGTLENPTYKTYGDGGHREVVQVVYDANQIDYEGLLYYFVKHIDPTDGEGSFVDRGVKYSPAIYYETEAEREVANAVLSDIESQDVYDKPLQVPVLPESTFWAAEDYHQDFYKKSIVRYKSYRTYSGRDAFVEKYWGEEADVIPE